MTKAVIKLRANEVVTIRRQEPNMRVRTGAPGLRGLAGAPGVGEGGMGLPSPGAADMLPYYSAPDTIALAALHPFSRGLLAGVGYSSWMTALGLRIFDNNIADDAAVQIDMKAGQAVNIARSAVLIASNNPSLRGTGFVWANAFGAPATQILFQAGGLINTVAGNGTLTGTTGPDGGLNVRTNNAGVFSLENRTGALGGYTVFIFRS